MTTKHLISLFIRHEDLRTPSNFRRLAQRIATEFVGMEFNPRHVERFLEIVPNDLRPTMAEHIVLHAQRECGSRKIREPKGGISMRIERVMTRIQANAQAAQDRFDEGMLSDSEPTTQRDSLALRQRA